MSLEIYTPDDWPEDEPGTQLGIAANRSLRWSPGWCEGGWDDEEKQGRFMAWCAEHPDAVLPTDQGDLLAGDFHRRYAEAQRPSVTRGEMRAALRRHGRIP